MRVGRGRSTAQQLHKRVVFHCLYVRNGNGGAAAVLNGQLEELEQECRSLSICLFDRKYDRLGGTGHGREWDGWVGKRRLVELRKCGACEAMPHRRQSNLLSCDASSQMHARCPVIF